MLKDLYTELTNAIKEDRHGSREEHSEAAWTRLTKADLRPLWNAFVRTNYPAPARIVTTPGGRAVLPAMRHDLKSPAELASARRAREAAQTADARAMRSVIAKIVWHEVILPDGTLLRDATPKKLEQFGGHFNDIAKELRKRGGNTAHVGNYLSQTDLQNLYIRNAPRAA